MYKASDEKQVKAMKEKENKALKSEVEMIRAILRLPEGREFFKKIRRSIDEMQPMSGNSWTYYHLGAKAYADALWDDLVFADPEKAARIQIEINKERVGGLHE